MFSDLKVIDAASYVAGPAAATVLGDYGAEVIKVEPLAGDGYRRLARHYRTDYNWLLTSRNKRSIALDFSVTEGREVLERLLSEADVLIVNFSPRELKKFDLEFDELQRRHPRLILAQITDYGTRGPEANRGAFDLAAWWARSGIMSLMKPADGAPVSGPGGVGDHASAMSLLAAIMMALYRREKTGAGSHVTTSLAANGAWAMGRHLQGAMAGFEPDTMLAEADSRSPFTLCYQTRDESYLVLAGVNPDREWPLLCRALGHPEWLADQRFADMAGILRHPDEVRALFDAAFCSLPLQVACRQLDEAGATYSVVETLADVVEDAQLIENDVLIRTGSENPDYQWTVNSPVEMTGVSKRPVREAPGIGEHSVDVLQRLGYTAESIEALVDSGVVRKFRRSP